MNFEDALKAGGASATMIAIVGIAVKLIQSFCGKRIRSECCGHSATAGVSVEPITPPPPRNTPRSSPMLSPTAAATAPPAIDV